VLATAHLRLRALEDADILDFRTLVAAHPASGGTIGVPQPPGAGFADQWMEFRNATWGHPRALHWAVCELSNDRLLGYTGLHHIESKNRQAELSFWIGGKERRSYALEAAQAALAFAFATLQLHRVCAFHLASNLCAGLTLTRIGMRPEGVLRQRVCRSQQFEDVIASAILSQDWLQSL
jgi:RimJ/RimL family protein N-acetyltransferase